MNTGLKFLDSLVAAVNAVNLDTVDPDFMPNSDIPEGAVVVGEMPEFARKLYVYNAQQNVKVGEIDRKVRLLANDYQYQVARHDLTDDPEAPNTTPEIDELAGKLKALDHELDAMHANVRLTSFLWSQEVRGFFTDDLREKELDLLVCKGWQVVAFKKPKPACSPIAQLLSSMGVEVIPVPLPRG